MNNAATAIDTAQPLVTHNCQVISVAALSANTFEVELQAPTGTKLGYQAGQYLQLGLDLNQDGQLKTLPYSIANRCNPEQPRRLQLLIQKSSELSDKILKHLSQLNTTGSSLEVTLPMGKAFLQTNLNLPHLLIAAGSGIAKIKAITEEILNQQPHANVSIYWSNKHIDDFYLLDEFQSWVDENQNLKFATILESEHSQWTGRSGYIYEVISEDFNNLNNTQTYLCGSPNMVYGSLDKLKPIGLKEENCYSDVFEYAPRG